MIGLRLDVPVASWRRGAAREYLETEVVPPPSTCYGSLLSLVGEEDPGRHRGCRVTAGIVGRPAKSVVFRSLWQVKSREVPRGNKDNVGPDLQEILTGAIALIWCDSSEERGSSRLEDRVRAAIERPGGVIRHGGWSLGESSHLVDAVAELPEGLPPPDNKVFVVDAEGPVTLPVWVDHVGSKGTRYAVGRLQPLDRRPDVSELAVIPLA
jgi:CRISPR-associated protein Cas5t